MPKNNTSQKNQTFIYRLLSFESNLFDHITPIKQQQKYFDMKSTTNRNRIRQKHRNAVSMVWCSTSILCRSSSFLDRMSRTQKGISSCHTNFRPPQVYCVERIPGRTADIVLCTYIYMFNIISERHIFRMINYYVDVAI